MLVFLEMSGRNKINKLFIEKGLLILPPSYIKKVPVILDNEEQSTLDNRREVARRLGLNYIES